MTAFAIAGAGLAGSMLAAFLGRAGHSVTVVERRPDPRHNPLDAGRSINLAISARGLHALAQLGLRDRVLATATPLYGRMIHPIRGPLAFQRYGTRGQAIHSMSRTALNTVLLDAAAESGQVSLCFERRVVGLNPETDELESVAAGGDPAPERHPGTVIGADGAYSVVRGELLRRERQDFSQAFLSHGYKELRIAPAPEGKPRLDPHALHIWPRGGYMMMAMANPDASFTVTIYLAYEGANSFAELADPAAVRRFFALTFPDALDLLPEVGESFLAHPTGSLVTIRTRPWHHLGRVGLIGDAAHAIVPFFGQGANAAFEDCLALAGTLEQHPRDHEQAFRRYEAERRPNADAIADLALANFHEMRDHVASPLFRLEKRGEVWLHRLFPRWYVPLYTMISFTLIPYAEARSRARRQTRAVRIILGLIAVTVVALLGFLL